jgi:putative hydrolase of the HAD superfamily
MNVVFDFGAVLFTWRPLEIVAEYFPECANSPSEAGHLAHAIFGHEDWHQFDAGTVTQEAVVQRTAVRLGLAPAVLAAMVEGIAIRLMPMADTVVLLTELHAKGVPLYYLSNMPVPYARALEKQHGFLRCFAGGIFSGDVNLIKPNAAIFQLLQTRYALEPAQTVFIDDMLGNVQAAQALGWKGIHFESAAQVAAQLQALNLSES